MPTVAIIDDQFTSRQILVELIKGIEDHLVVETFASPGEALRWAHWHRPDLVLTDYKMPEMDGIEFIQRLRTVPACRDIPVVMITSLEDRNVRYSALEAGATDFLIKPVDHIECRVRCRNLLTQRRQQKIIQDRTRWLERRVSEATSEIRVREQETLLRLAKAGEYRDEVTGNHVVRMAKFSRLIAEKLGLPDEECSVIELAAPMHDIGKIGIPDHILSKPARLTEEEFGLMKTHTQIGYEILKDSPSKYLQMGAVIALGHHERVDGSGYPKGLRGEEIPLVARIVAVADAYDALTSERPYKTAWSVDAAVRTLNDARGTHFDPRCLDAFNSQLDQVLKVQYLLRDPGREEQSG
ncbi:MAG TPA: HD domain-containing phosphohydrolase [Gammaproteobacteria bacterium]|nr:HD domain-containing phosphohydrolase [Gammaproteobacteria bacterium]